MAKIKLPLKTSFPVTQIFNQKEYRSSYAKFGLLGHNGVDFGCPQGTEIIAPHDGKVVENLFDATGYGNYVKIENDVEFSVLAHFKSLSPLKVGTEVKQGDVVGLSGNTGNSTGAHLHWGYCFKPRNKDNGFNGYVDQQLVMVVQSKLPSDEELDEIRVSRDEWKKTSKEQTKEINTLKEKILALENKPQVPEPTPAEKAFFQKLFDSFVAWLKGLKNGNPTS